MRLIRNGPANRTEPGRDGAVEQDGGRCGQDPGPVQGRRSPGQDNQCSLSMKAIIEAPPTRAEPLCLNHAHLCSGGLESQSSIPLSSASMGVAGLSWWSTVMARADVMSSDM